MNISVTLWIGIRLQENMRNTHVIDTLDQLVDISTLLGRIFVIHIIQIDMHNAHRLRFTHLADLAGKALKGWVIRYQNTGDIIQKRGICQPFVERKRHLVTVLFGQT